MYGNFVILGWKVSIFRSARWVWLWEEEDHK
jgi:hypothetical protein